MNFIRFVSCGKPYYNIKKKKKKSNNLEVNAGDATLPTLSIDTPIFIY